MYLHIGEDTIVFLKDILAIMDIEKTTTSNTTRDYLRDCQEKGYVVTVGTDIPKSFIVAVNNGKPTVYLSPISPATLNKRVSKPAKDYRRRQPNACK